MSITKVCYYHKCWLKCITNKILIDEKIIQLQNVKFREVQEIVFHHTQKIIFRENETHVHIGRTP